MRRTGLVIAGVLLAVVAMVGFVYAFGVPQSQGAAVEAAPSASSPGAAQLTAEQEGQQAQVPDPARSDAPGAGKVSPDAVAPAPDPSAPLAVQIPGCVCHSKDPKLVKQHAAYRMNQCAGCHVGGVPTGQN